MAYYTALVAKWATLNPGTTQQKLDQINAITVANGPQPMIVPTYRIFNVIDPTEYLSLTAAAQARVNTVLSMGTVDGSPGTQVRAVLQSIFTGKPTTLNALASLAATFDASTQPWWKATVAQGGGGLSSPVGLGDLQAAGLS
jgi:hypothetical protein